MKLWSVQTFSQTNTCCEENVLLCRNSIGIFPREDAKKRIADWIEEQALGYSESQIDTIIEYAMKKRDIISPENKRCKCVEFLLVEQLTFGEILPSAYDLIDNVTLMKDILSMKTDDQLISEVKELLKRDGIHDKLEEWITKIKSRVS